MNKPFLLTFILYVFFANSFFAQDTLLCKNKILYFDSLIDNETNIETIEKLLDSSKFYFNKAQDKFSRKDSKLLHAKIHEGEGVALLYKGKFVEAANKFTDALSLYKRINSQEGIASCYGNIGYAYSELGNYPLALEYYLKALDISKRKALVNKIAIQYNNIGEVYREIGRFDEAAKFYKKSLKIYQVKKDTNSLAYIYNNMASVYKRQGKYKQAPFSYNKALEIMQIYKDWRSSAIILSNIGAVYKDWNRQNLALDFFKQALNYDEKTGNIIGKAIRYNNIASVFSEIKMTDSAFFYYNKAEEIFNHFNLKKYEATIKTNKAGLLINSGKFDDAIKLLQQSANIFTEINDKNNLARTYLTISKAYKLANKFSSFQNNIEKSIKLAKEIKSLPILSEAYKLYANEYALKGIYMPAYKFLNQYIDIKDSIFSLENQKQINSFQVKYNTIAQENKIKLLENENKIKTLLTKKQEAELRQQRIITLVFIIGFIAFIVFLLLLWRQYKAKKIAHDILFRQNNEIKRQKEEIMIQRDIVIEQRDLITEQKQYLTDSIKYARHIQQAVLPSIEQISSIANEFLLIYKPLDIVSGDFYWVKSYNFNNHNYKVIVVADSTGHGVPGAFMSMLGLSSLNDIFNDALKENTPAYILNKMREKVISALNQYGKSGEAKDGMDMSIVIIDEQNKTLHFAGANHNLLILSKTEKIAESFIPFKSIKNTHLYKFRGNKMPVGISSKLHESFTNIKIPYSTGDIIYMKTDGYTDQFGGANGKKFKNTKFYQMLININSSDLKLHKKIIEEELDSWMTKEKIYTQIDDILVMAVKLS